MNEKFTLSFLKKKKKVIHLLSFKGFVPIRFLAFLNRNQTIVVNTALPFFKNIRGHTFYIIKKEWSGVINRYQNQSYKINILAVKALIRSSFFSFFQVNHKKVFASFASFVYCNKDFFFKNFSIFLRTKKQSLLDVVYNRRLFMVFICKYLKGEYAKLLQISYDISFLKAFVNKKRKIFYSLYLDFRGRVMIKSRFNFINSKIIRACTEFSYKTKKIQSRVEFLNSSGWKFVFMAYLGLLFPKQYKNDFSYYLKTLRRSADSFIDYPNGFFCFSKNFFYTFYNTFFEKAEQDISKKELLLHLSTVARDEKDFIISLDASGCIIQILGLIIGSTVFLKASNVISTQRGLIIDPYQGLIIKALENALSSSTLSDKEKENVSNLLDVITAKNFSNNTFRQALKMFIITFMFNSSRKKRSLVFIKNMKGVRLSKTLTQDETTSLLGMVLEKHFPELELMKKFVLFLYRRGKVQEIHGRPSVITTEKTVVADYLCIKDVKTSIFKLDPSINSSLADHKHGRFRPTIYVPDFDAPTYKIQKRKSNTAFMPHLLHSLESQLFFFVLSKTNSKMPICGVHDCFIVHPNLAEDVIFAYKEGLLDLFESFSSERSVFFKNRPKLESQFKQNFKDTIREIVQIDPSIKKVNVSTLSRQEIEAFIRKWIIESEYPLSPFLLFYLKIVLFFFILQIWCNGNTLVFQTNIEGSNPFIC